MQWMSAESLNREKDETHTQLIIIQNSIEYKITTWYNVQPKKYIINSESLKKV